MQLIKKTAGHICVVVKGMLFIGFSIQIVLGLVWMCCNFAAVQDFGTPDSALYRGVFRLFGQNPRIIYLIQLAAAYLAGDYLLQGVLKKILPEDFPAGKAFTAWGSLVLLTFPFAMQCHLAILPHSFISSLFLSVLTILLKFRRGQGRKKCLQFLGMITVCIVLMASLSGIADSDKRDMPGRSLEGMLASRVAWPTLWVDHERWPEELQEIVKEVLWESTYYPGNMKMLQETIEEQAGIERAKEYYMRMAKEGWNAHAYMIVRQIGWDVLGYMVTPVIFPLQLQGEAYASYTGRNYEIMRGNAPVLTFIYVEYACWWFVCSLALAVIYVLACIAAGLSVVGKGKRKALLVFAAECIVLSGIAVSALTVRGAGIMDYKCTIAVNELWLLWVLLPMGMPVRKRIAGINGCRDIAVKMTTWRKNG